MRKLLLTMLWIAISIMPLWAAKAYEMEVLNLVQVNETEFTFDMRMRNSNPSEPFAIEAIQWQLSFNTALMNGGSLNNTYLTYVSGTTDLVGVIIPNSLNFSTNQLVIQWVTDVLLGGAQTTFFGDGSWKRIGTFRVQLRNAGNTAFHNFADVAHNLAFVPSQVIVNSCNYTTSGGLYYRNGAAFELITVKTLTNSLSSRQLAGYCFSGTGAWGATARWNNVTTANAQTLPGATNNAIIAGACTITDTRIVKDLTVAQGGYLVINPAKQLTADNLYNDNTSGGSGSGTATIAEWDLQNSLKTTLPYTADNGTSSNKDIATLSVNVAVNGQLSTSYGSRAARARFWTDEGNGIVVGDEANWTIHFTSQGYQNLKISSKQYSTATGPTSWKLQYSLNNLNWIDISGGDITVATNWTTGVVSNLVLPTQLNNITSVYIRWLIQNAGEGYSAIDDISVIGDLIPVGMLIQSAVEGTGSLIHNNTGVEATMQRYMSNADWTNWKDGWHFLSSPVASQSIDPAFTAAAYDFYSWYEPENTWVNYKNTGTAPTWATANTISNGLSGNNTANFLVGKGYMAAYDVEGVKEFSGVLNVSDVQISGLGINTGTNRSWHLLGNPFSSALTWYTGWTVSPTIQGVSGIWNEAGQSYSSINAGDPIPATQGVMVRVLTGTGSLTIPAASRVHSTQAFYKNTGYPVLKLYAHNIDYPSFQESQVRFNPDSEKGFDPQYDGEFLAGYAPFFYSVLANEKLAVNSMPSLTSDTEIPFTFVKNEGSNFKIEAQGTEDLTYMAWLLDKKTNTDHNLSENPVYLFNASPEDSPERFLLHFGSVSVGNETHFDNYAIWYNSGSLYFSALPVNCVSVAVIDMAGRELKTVESPKVSKVEIGQSFAKGWYLAKVTTTDSVVVRKIFIN